jgi:hypothetical protein
MAPATNMAKAAAPALAILPSVAASINAFVAAEKINPARASPKNHSVTIAYIGMDYLLREYLLEYRGNYTADL